jgi:hypothetical protein
MLTAALPGHALNNIPLPEAYWNFDLCAAGAGGVMDDSTNSYDATLSSGATCVPGRYGSAASFDGVDDRVEAASSTSLNFTNLLTVTAWVKPANISSAYRTIVAKWYTPDSYGIFVQNSDYIFTVALANGTYVNVRAPGSAVAGQWTHVTGVFNGSTAAIYINGSQVGPALAAAGTLQQSARPVSIGIQPAWNAFPGLIDEVRLYRAALDATQIAGLATPPSTLGVRGLHLYGSQWIPGTAGTCPQNKHEQDLSRLQYLANINSVKSILVSALGSGQGNQMTKLTQLKAAAGNHVTWIFRAWPMTPSLNAGYVDLTPGSNYYNQGFAFAQNLAPTFAHIQLTLKLQNVYIEVANEPNIGAEGFVDGTGWPSTAAYNDFFRGFYDGERSMGYSFPLVYAGLSPGPDDTNPAVKRLSSDTWYLDFWVRNHIQNYAAKIGAHVYWASGQRSVVSYGGKYYQRIHDLLAAGGVTPRGIVITELNGRRSTFGNNPATQAADVCAWWKDEAVDGSLGWWVEQAQLWVSNVDCACQPGCNLATDDDSVNYTLQDSQLDAMIRNCQ